MKFTETQLRVIQAALNSAIQDYQSAQNQLGDCALRDQFMRQEQEATELYDLIANEIG